MGWRETRGTTEALVSSLPRPTRPDAKAIHVYTTYSVCCTYTRQPTMNSTPRNSEDQQKWQPRLGYTKHTWLSAPSASDTQHIQLKRKTKSGVYSNLSGVKITRFHILICTSVVGELKPPVYPSAGGFKNKKKGQRFNPKPKARLQ